MRTGPRTGRRHLPAWARIALFVYLVAVAALIAVALVANVFHVGAGSGLQDTVMFALVALTLPVSAAYYALDAADSSSFRALGAIGFGFSDLDVVLYYLGFLFLAAVNATAFRWIVLGLRRDRQALPMVDSSALPQDAAVEMYGVNGTVRHLWWSVSLAVLLSLPQWLVAGFMWCGISGCSGGGFGVSTSHGWVAACLSAFNGVLLAVAVFAVPWLRPARTRAVIAITAGGLFGLVGAAVTHG